MVRFWSPSVVFYHSDAMKHNYKKRIKLIREGCSIQEIITFSIENDKLVIKESGLYEFHYIV